MSRSLLSQVELDTTIYLLFIRTHSLYAEMEVNVVGQPQKCASTSTGVITFDVQGGAGNYNYSVSCKSFLA